MTETPGSTNISPRLRKIAELAKQAPELAFTTLAHHIDIDLLREAFRRTRKDAAVGVDGMTAGEYTADLEGNLRSLLDRAKAGTYRAPPVRRVYIPKGDGKEMRPLGIPTFEDKVLQRAVVMVLEAVYEQDFLDCSYAYRRRRSASPTGEDSSSKASVPSEATKAEAAKVEATKTETAKTETTKTETTKAEATTAAPEDPEVPAEPIPPAESADAPEAIVLFDDVTTASVLDAESFAKCYPKLQVEEERIKGKLRGLSLDQGKEHVLDVALDDQRHPYFGNIRGKAVEIAGTTLRIGASFDEVVKAMHVKGCHAEYGAEPWVICNGGPFAFTWVVDKDLKDAPELSVAQARSIVGRRRLESVQFSIERK